MKPNNSIPKGATFPLTYCLRLLFVHFIQLLELQLAGWIIWPVACVINPTRFTACKRESVVLLCRADSAHQNARSLP